jgi:hypothetical protein
MKKNSRHRQFPDLRKLQVIGLGLAFSAVLCAFLAAQDAEADKYAFTIDHSVVLGKDFVLNPPGGEASFFRFLPGGTAAAFDRGLLLSAAAGEERSYLVQVGPSATALQAEPVVAYSIDKRRPRAPVAEPGSGLYRGAIELSLKAEEGSRIYWTITGPESDTPSFALYGPELHPRLPAPESGSVTYMVLAYAVDSAGNRSYPSRFVYRLAEDGLPSSSPQDTVTPLSVDASLSEPQIEEGRGFAVVKMPLASGSSFIIDFNADSPPQSLDDFERIEADKGFARVRVPCPYAWSGEVDFFYGIVKEGAARGDASGGAFYSPRPYALHLSYPADEMSLPNMPPEPILAADPSGKNSFACFPSYDGNIYVSVGGSSFALCESPIALSGGARTERLSWFGEDQAGTRTATRSKSFILPEALPDVSLEGIAEGALSASDAVLKVSSKDKAATVRYELSLDGSLPPEPGVSSPLFVDALTVPCPQGRELSVVLRYRSFSASAASEGRILRFTLDRKPPEQPSLRESPPGYSDRPARLEFLHGQDGREVFASISSEGSAPSFHPVLGPIELPGSDEGPIEYLVRAYDVDEAGNRSPEMKSLSVVVDRSSVYVAEDGEEKGDGSPSHPYKSLDLALSAAKRGGKRSVNMRGSLELRQPASFSSDVVLVGGFGPSWDREGSMRAVIRSSLSEGSSAFTQSGGSLSLRRVELRADRAGGAPLIHMASSSLSMEDSSIVVGSDLDLILVSAARSKIRLSGTMVQATRAMAFTVFSCEGCDISVSGSSLSAAQAVHIFGVVDMKGGSLSLRESLIESRADLGLNLLSLRSARLLVDRSLVNVSGGSGYLRIGAFESVTGDLRNSKFLLSWKGPGTLFELAGEAPAFLHDTIVADTSSGTLRFFDAKGQAPRVWNSILDCASGGGELLRSATALGAGSFVADCVWGFDHLLSGASEAKDLRSLNALNSSSALYSSRPVISEPPERTFAATVKSQAPLRRDSACVGAALPLESGFELDFSGHSRASSGSTPAIGADEYSN